MEQVVDLALPEYFERISAEATFQEQLSVIDMDNSRRSPVQVKNYPIRLKGYSLIFVLSGEITIGINYLSHTLKKNTVMQVYPDDIIEHTAYSADFKGYLIIHSAELKKEIMAMTSGIRLQQAGQLKKLHTRQELSEEESLRLRKQVELIKSYIPDKEHVYHSYVIKNQIINLFFDLDTAAGIGMATESWDYPAVKPSVNGSGNYLWKNAGCTEKSLFMQTNFVLLLIIYRKWSENMMGSQQQSGLSMQ